MSHAMILVEAELTLSFLEDLPPLALRQERCALKNARTLLTFDSWDFATTVHSPIISTPARRPPKDFVQFETSASAEPWETEDSKFNSELGRHAKPIPWIEVQEQDEKDFSSSDSDASSGLADSGPPSSDHEPSPPSSILEFEPQDADAPLEVGDDDSPAAGGEKSASKTITHCASFIVPSQTVKAISVSRSSPHTGVPSSPPLRTQSSFWTRWKMNVRRSASRNNLYPSRAP